ncbi:chymotrypsin-1-like [Nomia melanderi]|uniref:chymotrypsin-1-like n=1 Tax=Nomia melanderi TaxID=2448451 RepID=UPI0013045381|nr:chymotrypsin-1-like [Nomia melanderi]
MFSYWVHLFLFGLVAFADANDRQRIVGGKNASVGQFPYMASLRVKNKHVCGGAIVSPNYILTAAHCVEAANNRGKLSEVTIVTGTIYLNSGGDVHAVTAMSYDPGYKNDLDKDVGIIKLARPITFNENQKPIDIATERPPEGKYVTVSGWGLTAYPSPAPPDNMQYQFIKVIKFSKCRFYFPTITTAVCTFLKVDVGVCFGDSGSPLVYNNQVVAVASRVVPCAKGYPDLFSSTADSMGYIRKAMSE